MLTKISVTYLTVVSKYHTLAVLNLAVWPQTDRKKYMYWWNLNSMVAPQVCLSRSDAVSHLKHMNKAMSSQFTKNKTGSMLAPS